MSNDKAERESNADDFPIDEALRFEVIRGILPLRIMLDSREVASTRTTIPLYLAVSRMICVPQLFALARDHYNLVLLPKFGQQQHPWMDFRGCQLDWRLPIGVLIDSLCTIENECLPLSVTIHFHFPPSTARARSRYGEPLAITEPITKSEGISHRPPSQPLGGLDAKARTIPPCTQWKEFQSYFINCFRQAVHIYHDGPRTFQGLQREKQFRLYGALRDLDLYTFENISTELLLHENNPSAVPKAQRVRRRTPIVVHVYGPPHLLLEIAPHIKHRGENVRIYDVLMSVFPTFLHKAIRAKALLDVNGKVCTSDGKPNGRKDRSLVGLMTDPTRCTKITAEEDWTDEPSDTHISSALSIRDPCIWNESWMLPQVISMQQSGTDGAIIQNPLDCLKSGTSNNVELCEVKADQMEQRTTPNPVMEIALSDMSVFPAAEAEPDCAEISENVLKHEVEVDCPVVVESLDVIVEGVHASLLTPIGWLMLHARCIDCRIHILVKLPPELVGDPSINDV